MAQPLVALQAVQQKHPLRQDRPISSSSSNLVSAKPTGPLSREYNPPPRPKPGRKPSTDTPPNKRKAQNRQAQRNFRERRAQKISELEEVIDEKEARYREELAQYRTFITELQSECEKFQKELLSERASHAATTQRLAYYEELLKKNGIVPLRLQTRTTAPMQTYPQTPTAKPDVYTPATSPAKCDDCGPGNCACMEAMTNAESTRTDGYVAVREHTPPKESEEHKYDPTPMEIDFTTRPAAPSRNASYLSNLADASNSLLLQDPNLDSCGFCKDGTPCLCREMQQSIEQEELSPKAPMKTGQSRNDRGGCTGNPGSCSQCQADPMSEKFCKSLAKEAKSETMPSSSVTAKTEATAIRGCGLTDCCQLRRPTSRRRTDSDQMSSNQTQRACPVLPSIRSGLPMDCASAYQKLKTHPNFGEAMAHKEEWMHNLLLPLPNRHGADGGPLPSPVTAVPPSKPLESRPAYEIDAASVMATFRQFDTRFGKDSRNDWKKEA